MNVATAFSQPLPPAAEPALAIVARLADAGFRALLAGGCVRDLLRGSSPSDYDVATSARPEEVARVFRATRRVGAQFGVMLVRSRREWVEVATFRRDAAYEDGRRPTSVTFADPEEDARRRDFTINGMFLDPVAGQVLDYVGGRDDLAAGQIRAIGDPAERFAEDHLRLLRAVRFAARLGFRLEPETAAAIRGHADRLARIAPERRRDELEKILADPGRAVAFELLRAVQLLPHLWQDADWPAERCDAAGRQLAAAPAEAGFEVGLAILLDVHPLKTVGAICRRLTCSNQQRATVMWLREHRDALAAPEDLSLPDLKRLAVHPALAALRALTRARQADADRMLAAFDARLSRIAPEQLRPEPFVTGHDLADRGVARGPIYAALLRDLYERQLSEEFGVRADALLALDEALRSRGAS